MANDPKVTETKADEKKAQAIEEQAFKDGKLQSGYQYHYEPTRDENGAPKTIKVVEKIEQ